MWWPWFVIGLVLLIIEVLGAGGFLVGLAAGGFAVGLVVLFVPDLSVFMQITLFAIISLIATLIYFKFFRVTEPGEKISKFSPLEGMIGKQFEVTQDLTAGLEVREQIGDTLWRIRAEDSVEKGDRVIVTGEDSMCLLVKPATSIS